jgi:SAM-dependent methyltransferase
MPFTLEDWHTRYLQQARWTESLRRHIFSAASPRRAGRILEVGCGTGAVLESAAREFPTAQFVGLDIDIPRLAFARSRGSSCECAGGDALRLPFGGGVFELTFCHYFLLWVRDPDQAVREMIRVTRRGGWVAALAEPDYGARIDYPEALAGLGGLQRQALRRQGADPDIGRRLAGLLAGAGLTVKEGGVLGSQITSAEEDAEEADWEWMMLKEDIGRELAEEEWRKYREIDRAARKSGRRVLFVPTFYAAGIRE